MTSPDALRERFEQYVRDHPVGLSPQTLYDPASYIMSLGGKRMRPVLLLLAYGMWHEPVDEALPAALAIEVFHNFTLVHDDMMDAAQMRRGKPTVHQKYGTNSAILSGDVMLIRSFDLLLQSCHRDNVIEVMETMTEVSMRICEGQQLDLDFESRDKVTQEEYLEMITLKTAVLLGAAMKIGALLAGAPAEEADHLYNAGLYLGKAFQIQDDVLDAYGDEAVTGKRRGGDIVNAKKTILYTSLLGALSPARAQTLIELYKERAANPEVKIQQVLRWFEDHDMRANSEALCMSLYREGLARIDAAQGSVVGRTVLSDYVGHLLDRKL